MFVFKSTLENLIDTKYPILLGAMAGISDPSLASAVSEAGGLGTLAGGLETGDTMSAQIKKMRELTEKPFSVNIPIHYKRAEELVDSVLHEGVGIVISAAGDPRIYTKRLKDAGIKVIHVVSTPQMAVKAEEAGVDAIIAEGFESGGMASKYEIGTLALVPQVVDAVKIPVIAAGGIADARGYLAARVLGASGVSLGTAFMASKECVKISQLYREMILRSDASDTAIAARGAFSLRAVKNKFYDTVEEMVARGAGGDEIKKFVYTRDPAGEDRYFSCGQGVGLIKSIKSIKEIIEGIISGAGALEALCPQASSRVAGED